MLYSVEVPAPTPPDRFYEGTVYWFETYNQAGAHLNAAVGFGAIGNLFMSRYVLRTIGSLPRSG